MSSWPMTMHLTAGAAVPGAVPSFLLWIYVCRTVFQLPTLDLVVLYKGYFNEEKDTTTPALKKMHLQG